MATTITEKGNGNVASHSGSAGDSLGDVLAKNSRVILLFIAGFFIVAGIGTFMMSKRDSRSEEGKNALYGAQESMEKELKAIAASIAPPAKPAAGASEKSKEAKAPEPDTAQAAFVKVDVDAKFPETVKKLQAVAGDFTNTRAGYEARVMLGDLYMKHGESAKALSWLEQAANDAPNSEEKAMSWMNLGYAQENSGKNADAIATFEKALKQGGDSKSPMKGELLLAIARNHELTQNFAQARSTYDRISSEMPNSETARTADTFKAQLPK